MNVWLLRFIVFFVALVAVWQLAAVLVWAWERVRRKGLVRLAQGEEKRPEM